MQSRTGRFTATFGFKEIDFTNMTKYYNMGMVPDWFLLYDF
jgi:hypothetical protein